MKTTTSVAFGILLGVSGIASAFAQAPTSPYDSSKLKTRAEVIADSERWFAAGFDPLDSFHYPGTAMKASRVLLEQREQPAGSTQ